MNVPGNTSLMEKLQWLYANAQSDGEYAIVVTGDANIETQTLSFPGKTNITVRIGGEGKKTISLVGKGNLFSVRSGVTLILGSGVVLRGCNENNASLVGIEDGGSFMMTGGEISNNKSVGSPVLSSSGGVSIAPDGKFTMTGGQISCNITSGCGGGVRIFSKGTFEMKGGKIFINSAMDGGGVYVGGGTFTMTGGEISSNTASNVGGGVYTYGSFTMVSGEISGNHALDGTGGVFVDRNGTFVMTGGKLEEKSVGGPGIFDMRGGTISNSNSLQSFTSSNSNTSENSGCCYIATAVYGSYDAPEVLCLRRFRDEILLPSVFGRLFITLYYRFSPPIAEKLKNAGRINMFVRKALDKLVERLNKKFRVNGTNPISVGFLAGRWEVNNRFHKHKGG